MSKKKQKTNKSRVNSMISCRKQVKNSFKANLKKKVIVLMIRSGGLMSVINMTGLWGNTLNTIPLCTKKLRHSLIRPILYSTKLPMRTKSITRSLPSLTTTEWKTIWLDIWTMLNMIKLALSTHFPLASVVSSLWAVWPKIKSHLQSGWIQVIF